MRWWEKFAVKIQATPDEGEYRNKRGMGKKVVIRKRYHIAKVGSETLGADHHVGLLLVALLAQRRLEDHLWSAWFGFHGRVLKEKRTEIPNDIHLSGL